MVASALPVRLARVGDLIVAPAAFGSVGDLAMLQGLQSLLARDGGGPQWIASPTNDHGWSAAGTLSTPSRIPSGARAHLAWSRTLRRLARVFVIGADVLDGSYSVEHSVARIRFCGFAARLGAQVTVTGFSMRADPPTEVARALRALPPSVRLCVRDPLGAERVRAIMGAERAAQVVGVADLAFLVEPNPDGAAAAAALAWIDRERGQGATLVALCPNHHAVRPAGPERCVAFFVEVARSIARTGADAGARVRFVLVSHDDRGPDSDTALCRRIAAQLPDGSCVQVAAAAGPAEVKAVVGACDALVSGRMHCGIAALGMSIPVVLLDYHGKVAGLLGMFGLDSAIRSSTDAPRAAELLRKFTGPRRSEVRAALAARLPAVRALAEGNLLTRAAAP